MEVYLTESGSRIVDDLRGRDPLGAHIDSHEDSTPLWMYFTPAQRLVLSALESNPNGIDYQSLGRTLPSNLQKDYKAAIETLLNKWHAIRTEN